MPMQNNEGHPLTKIGWIKMKTILDKEMPVSENRRRFLPLFFLGFALALLGYAFLAKNVKDNDVDHEFFQQQNLLPPPFKAEVTQISDLPIIADSPQMSNSSQISGLPVLPDTPIITDSPHFADLSNIKDSPIVADSPQISDLPNITLSPQITKSPILTDTPLMADSPQFSDSPNIADSPQMSDSPNIAYSPHVLDSPQLTDSPQLSSYLSEPTIELTSNFNSQPTAIMKTQNHGLAMEIGAFSAPTGSYQGAELSLGYKRYLFSGFYVHPFLGASMEYFDLSYVPQINKVYTDSESLELQSEPLVSNGNITIDNSLNQVQSFNFISPQFGVNLGINLNHSLSAIGGVVSRYYLNTNLEKFVFDGTPQTNVGDSQNALLKRRLDVKASIGLAYNLNRKLHITGSYQLPLNQSFYTQGSLISSIDNKQAIKVAVGYNF